MSSQQETSPLLPTGSSAVDGKNNYYFLQHEGGTTDAVRDADGGQVHETLPEGASADEFAPRMVGTKPKEISFDGRNAGTGTSNVAGNNGTSLFTNLWNTITGGTKTSNFSSVNDGTQQGSGLKQRKAPIKIEPKVFFANERTFLAWMHISIILAGGSIAILAFAEDDNPGSQLYGVVLLPVAIAFIVYSMYQYSRRASMIRTRHPGPYEDTVGPIVLGGILMLSICCQFGIKMFGNF